MYEDSEESVCRPEPRCRKNKAAFPDAINK